MPSTYRRVLASRATIATFGVLAVTWFLPEAVSAIAPDTVGVLGPLLRALVIPAYVLNLLVYDGGLEAVVSPVADAVPAVGFLIWDVGLLVVFYGFAVVATLVGRALARRVRRIDPDSGGGRYVLAGALVTFGALFLISGAASAVTQPTTTVTSCTATGTASQGGAATTVAETCTTETRPSPFPGYAVVAGVGTLLLGAAVVAGDVWIARSRRP